MLFWLFFSGLAGLSYEKLLGSSFPRLDLLLKITAQILLASLGGLAKAQTAFLCPCIGFDNSKVVRRGK